MSALMSSLVPSICSIVATSAWRVASHRVGPDGVGSFIDDDLSTTSNILTVFTSLLNSVAAVQWAYRASISGQASRYPPVPRTQTKPPAPPIAVAASVPLAPPAQKSFVTLPAQPAPMTSEIDAVNLANRS